MLKIRTITYAGLTAILICLSLSPKAETEFYQPPNLPEREKPEFDEWLKSAQKKHEDRVFSDAKGRHLNALVESTSPYLRQHAKNPVNWKPWRNQYLAQARSDNKLIFLSIGYSTCHWCHTMAKESFSDAEVAKAINSTYVAIKVDREELPQIDRHYAALLEAATGSAGWPITAIINGDGLPIFIDSYLSKAKLITLLERVAGTWDTNPDFLLASAKTLSGLITSTESKNDGQATIDTNELLENSKQKIVAALDVEFGGLNGQVKFPQESLLLYLLDEFRRTEDHNLKKLVSIQLDNMMNGGIRDHVDGGFHRYSTDKEWIIPHYEKMLYNQALMAQVYLEAWQVFYNDNYRLIAQETLDFAIERLYQPDHGFYSALDADLNGEEGGFYLWSETDLEDFLSIPGITSYTFSGDKGYDGKLGILTDTHLRSETMTEALSTLSKQRHNRGELHRDDKVITSWNGLMVYSLAMASHAFDERKYLTIAEKVAGDIWQSRFDRKTGKLFRTSDRSQELFSLEDYAYLSRGFIGLYDITQNPEWLDRAEALYQAATTQFSSFQHQTNTGPGPSISSSLADGELISPIIALQAVELSLKNRTFDAKAFTPDPEHVNFIKTRASESAINQFSSLLYLNNEAAGSAGNTRYFANGVGQFHIVCKKRLAQVCSAIEIQFSLKEGWHINSNTPLQDYLKPTSIESDTPLDVQYPEQQVIRLGFQDEALGLFEGEFVIQVSKISRELVNRAQIRLPLQACNDEICLLPEDKVIVF